MRLTGHSVQCGLVCRTAPPSTKATWRRWKPSAFPSNWSCPLLTPSARSSDASMIYTLRALDDVVMVEAYGELVFWGDVQTPAVKASSSSDYPEGAWDLGVSGEGIVIAMVDTGVDNEHLD